MQDGFRVTSDSPFDNPHSTIPVSHVPCSTLGPTRKELCEDMDLTDAWVTDPRETFLRH